MTEISLTNTVNVSLTAIPSGLGEPNTASTVIFSNEVANKSGNWFTITSTKDVADLYGSDSRTYAMAVAILAQSPNIRTARGQLYVAPFVATDATRGSLTTDDIKANIANFAQVKNGAITLAINGITKTVKGIDFTGCSTIEDVIGVLDALALDVEIKAVKENSTEKIAFISKMFGTESTVAISATASETNDLFADTFLKGATATAEVGVNHTAVEELKDAIARVSAKLDFGGILTTLALENEAVVETANTVQTMDRLLFYPVFSLDNIKAHGNAVGTAIKSANLNKTRLFAQSNSLEEAFTTCAGASSIALSPNFKASNTANTLNLKTITGSAPDKYVDQSVYNDAKQAGVDIYASTSGLSCVYSFDNGKYTDEAVGDLWLKRQIEVQVFNVLRQTLTKIPQTETGMIALKNAVERVCQMCVNNGLAGVGLTWNSADRFGNPEDFDRNITETGYYIYYQPIAQQDQVEREERKAPVIQTAIKRAGAIHSSDIIVVLER